MSPEGTLAEQELPDEQKSPNEQNGANDRGSTKSLKSLKEVKSGTAAACKAVAGANNKLFEKKGSCSMQALKRLQSTVDNTKTAKQRMIRRFLHSSAFEYIMGMIILSNVVVMIVEIDIAADDADALGNTTHWTEVFGWVVLIIFVVELILRLFAFRLNFWMDAWNIFDFIIVFTDLLAFIISLLAAGVFPVTVLRIFRLAKLARASKVLRVFPELRLLLASLLHSISAIFWGAVLLCLVLLVWAMIAVLFIHPLNKEILYDVDGCERCPRAYSSVMQAALTLWQQIVAGDEWGQGSIPIIEKHPATALFFIPLFLSLGMAVVNLILGMVVSVAQQAKVEFKEIDDAQAACVKLESQSNLLKLCRSMDVDNSGELSYEELHAAFEEPGAFQDSMESLNITKDDFNVVWAMMDPESTGAVSYKRLVSRLYRMKSSNSEFTLAYLKYHITLIKNLLTQMDADHVEEITAMKQKFEADLERFFGDVLLEHQERFFAKLQVAISGNSRKESTVKENHGEKLLDKLHVAACDAPQKEDKANASNGLARGLEASAEDKAVEESVREIEGKEPQTWEPVNKTLNGCRQFSKSFDDSRGEGAASVNDGTHAWLKRVCCDIEKTRLELRNLLMNVDRKLSATLPPFSARGALSAMERDIMSTEAQLNLLVVPEKASSCTLFPKGFCNAAEQHENRSTS